MLFGGKEVHAQGQEGKQNTVRVGWYQSDMFQEGISDEQVKRGYCYDYLQKVSDMLSEEYDILMAENGRQALDILEKQHSEISVVLLDLMMPEINGMQVLHILKKKNWRDQPGIIIISSESAVSIEKECFELGVSDFIHRPFDEHIVKRRVHNIVTLFQKKAEMESKIEQQIETLKKQYRLLLKQSEQLNQSKEKIIDILGTVVEYRNFESGEHIKRVKGYTRILAERLMKDYPEYGLTDKQVEVIVSASALHDIGKIAIPDSILMKPGKLSPNECEYMKSHTTRGTEILKNIKDAWVEEYSKASYEICRGHHERYDGKGYPDGLKGEEIPISAQIVSLRMFMMLWTEHYVFKKRGLCCFLTAV